MVDFTVWHDEAERLEMTGKLDPVDGCLCAECTAARGR